MNRGDVYWCTLDWPDKRRPVVILTRLSAIDYLTSITVAPLTTQIRNIPTEVLLTPEDDGVQASCVVNLDNIQTVHKRRLEMRITFLSQVRMQQIEYALCFALGIDRYA